MSLITGTPQGNLDVQEDIYLEGAPTLFVQDSLASPLFNPDADGFYYGLSGTAAYPVYELGCISDVKLTEGLTMNDVRCDNVGVVDTIQKRDYVEFDFTIKSFLPITTLRVLLSLGAVTVGNEMEKVGIGVINNNQKWMVYAPVIYDQETGDYLIFHLHKAKFVDAWTINMNYGNPWELTGIKLRAYADRTKLTTMQFGSIIRVDESVI